MSTGKLVLAALITGALTSSGVGAQDVDAVSGATVPVKVTTVNAKQLPRDAKPGRFHRRNRVLVPASGVHGRAARGDFDPGC